MPGYMQTDDPLGIGLRQRANAARRSFEESNRELGRANNQFVSFSNLGPLSDPMWDAFKQAYHEQGVTKMQGGSLTPSRFGESTVFDPSVQTGLDGVAPVAPEQTAMQSLQRSAGPALNVRKTTTPRGGRRFLPPQR